MKPQSHILVVEDDAQYRRLVTRMLETAGFRVTPVEDTSLALDVIDRKEHIDLLLTDIGMPAGTPHGFSVGKMAQLRGLKVLYMSGTDLGGGNLNGVALYSGEPMLRKPFVAAELIAAVKSVLG